MSHRAASISRTTSLSISKPYEQTTLAPAPRQALRAASRVSSGTSPMAAIFRPPAALLLAYLPSTCPRSSPHESTSSASALFRPMVTSVSMVVGDWALPRMTSLARSTARILVQVLPKSISR